MTRVAVLAAASVYQPSEVRKKSNLKFVQETPLENCSTDMSIEKAAEPLAPRMGSEKHRSKSEKRHKSAHGEKRENEITEKRRTSRDRRNISRTRQRLKPLLWISPHQPRRFTPKQSRFICHWRLSLRNTLSKGFAPNTSLLSSSLTTRPSMGLCSHTAIHD